MSTRSTPARPAGGTSISLFSPTGSSATMSQVPSRSGRLRGSLPFSNLGESSRKPSGGSVATARKPSSSSFTGSLPFARRRSNQSASGTSTPRRRMGKSNLADSDQLEERDWADMEADEVFRRLGVAEVKRVEAKMRNEAINKQSELRSMVGTRYRDLLTSATQITSLRKSSLHLSQSLKSISQSCLTSDSAIVDTPSEPDESKEAETVLDVLPVAAHMKLLLDAPDALYSYIAHHAYLKAAFLWLIARVTKESLSSMTDEAKAQYTPLLQKQWEVLLPFRSQITQRATAELRRQANLDSKTLCETLLAIVLLDNLPIPDALDLFLSQRTKCLRDMLSTPTPVMSAGPSSVQQSPILPLSADSRDVASTSKPVQPSENVDEALANAVECILSTVRLAEDCFIPPTDDKPSLLSDMVRLIQIGEPLAPLKVLNTPSTASSHQRRRSRLASFSTPLPPPTPGAPSPPISSARVLQDLASHQIFFRHLPNTITGFTPFITPSTKPLSMDAVSNWASSAIEQFRQLLPPWLAALHSVDGLWKLRTGLFIRLQAGGTASEIRTALDEAWRSRINEIWSEKLDAILQVTETLLLEALKELESNPAHADLDPGDFAFSEPPFPTMTSSLTTSGSSFNTFLSAIRKQKDGRTPLLDRILSEIESLASDLRADSRSLPDSLHDEYGNKTASALQTLVEILEKVLEQTKAESKDKSATGELLVGRVAMYIATSSTVLVDLTFELGGTGTTVKALRRIHSDSVIDWRKRSVDQAIKSLDPIFESEMGPDQVRAIWQGPSPTQTSPAIMSALFSLVKSCRQLGLPPNVDSPVVGDLVREFITAVRGLPGWEGTKAASAVQAAFDLGFLSLLHGDDPKDDSTVQSLLAKAPDSAPESFTSDLPNLLADQLRRTQVLMQPLLVHVSPEKLGAVGKLGDTKNGLLRFGPPRATGSGFGTEFRSPIAVAAPGKRFPLLSIAA